MDKNPASDANPSEEVTLQFLKSKIGNKKDFYNKLSTLYWMPAFNSKVMTKEYMKSYIMEPCPIFRLERKNYNPLIYQEKVSQVEPY